MESFFPDAITVSDVGQVSEEVVLQWAARSVLFKEVPRVSALFRKFFPWAQIHNLTENVASMSYEDCQTMCDEFEDYPWYIDAQGVSLCPRVYWISWELLDNEGVSFLEGSDGRLPIRGEVLLHAELEASKFLEPGWKLPDGKCLPTFTTAPQSSTFATTRRFGYM